MTRRWLRRSTVWGLLLAVAVAGSGTVWAVDDPTATTPPDTSPPAEGADTTIDEEASTPAGAQRVTERLAAEFNVETETIQSLREQQLGYGEIHHALSLAKQMPGGVTQENIDQVMAMRQDSQMGWGQIAQELGTKLGPSTKRGGQAPPVSEPPAPSAAGADSTSGAAGQAESITRSGSSPGKSGKSKGKGFFGLFGSRGGGVERSGSEKSKGLGAGGANSMVGGGAIGKPGHGFGQDGSPGQGSSAPGHNR
ncbi:MAG: hypothetical protein HY599_01630 [Candidatus Omnitrophica bacterium]|nr:hypothetical protein [Candidatus Omnitrophota bacterium]